MKRIGKRRYQKIMPRKNNDFEDIFQGIIAVVVLIVMGNILFPVFSTSIGGFLSFIVLLLFYLAIFLIIVGLVIRILRKWNLI